jgi:hypothetical protein
MDDKELNRAISRAKSNVSKKLDRIKKRENFSPEVIRLLDPRRNQYTPDMSRQEKEGFLSSMRQFTSKSVNYYRDAHGNPITADQWKSYKEIEKRANAFVSADIKKYGKIQMPIGDLTVAERQQLLRPTPGRMIANPSGSGMFLTNRKPSEVVSTSLDSLKESLLARLEDDYKARKSFEGRSQFEQMMAVIGDEDLIQEARALNDEQFWVIWNYTDFATKVSLDYSIMMEGMKTGLNKDAALGISQSSRSQAHRYVKWASKI